MTRYSVYELLTETEIDMDLETNVVEGKHDKDLEVYMTHKSKLVRKAAIARWKLLRSDELELISKP